MPRDGFLATLPKFSPLVGAPRASRAMLVYDPTLAWSALLLLSIGIVMVYSASIATAEASAYTGYRPWYFLARHAVFVVAGLAAGVIAFQVPVKVWHALAPYLFMLGAALLVAVLVPGIGRSINGSKRWLSLGLVNLQPSEFMKLLVVLYASSYAVRRATALAVIAPVLWQEQILIHHRHEVLVAVGQMHGDNAVVQLACAAAVLMLNAGRLVAFLIVATRAGRDHVRPFMAPALAERDHVIHR